jgi:hypothetical protein
MAANDLDRTLLRILSASPPLRSGAEPIEAAIDWEALARRAELHNLAALLFTALQHQRALRPPAEIAARLRHLYLQRTLANQVICDEAGRIVRSFAEHSIPLVCLKGVALLHSLYDDAGVRALGDIDLLVRPEDQARAGERMQRLGYEAKPDLADGFREEFESEQVYRRALDPPVVVDVHRHLFNVPYYRKRVSMQWFWDHTVPVTIAGQEGRMFDPAAQLLHLAPHGAFHHRGEVPRFTYDVALLIARRGSGIPWDATLAAAREFGLTPAVHAALAAVEELWRVPLSEDAKRALARFAPGRSERIAYAAITSPQNRARIVWDIWNMPGARAKLTYLGRSIVPTKDYMMRRYRFANPRMLPWYYCRRWLDGAGYFARSLGSMSRSAWRALRRAPE